MSIVISMPSDSLSFMRDEYSDVYETLSLNPGGVYVIYSAKGECLYVGQSKRLAVRLRTHLTSAPFAEEISKITVYFVPDALERELYETHAINKFGGKYNKAKVFRKVQTPPSVIYDEIDSLIAEQSSLLTEKDELLYELRGVRNVLYPKAPRKFNNLTGELSLNYMTYLDKCQRDYFGEDTLDDEYLYIEITRRLAEVDDELAELASEINRLKELLVS